MIKSIMVAVHRSPAAEVAMSLAAQHARSADARLTALYVEDPGRFVYVPLLTAATSPILGEPPAVAPLPPEQLLAEEARQEAEERDLRTAFTRVCTKQGFAGQFSIKQGQVDTLLLESARRVDLIVMGYDRGNTAGEGLIERVLRESIRPMLVVAEGARTSGPLLIAYDGRHPAQRAITAAASLVAAGAYPSIGVVTITDDPDDAQPLQDEARAYLEPYTSKIKSIVRVGDVVEGILSAATEIKAGCIAMGAFSSPTMQLLITGSITRLVLGSAPCPLLLVQ
jgi:nucleotide-binding universal stress UspA family protein